MYVCMYVCMYVYSKYVCINCDTCRNVACVSTAEDENEALSVYFTTVSNVIAFHILSLALYVAILIHSDTYPLNHSE